MYLGFYGLEREPFHITPDPDFLYLSPSHKEAFATIVYGVEQRKGFVALTGEVGTGKTTVLRAYLKRIDSSKIRAIYLFNPSLTFHDLLRILLRELGVEHPEEKHEPTMLEQLQWALLKEYEAKRNVALIVDEAQNMPVETLERMRMLSNLETAQDKLLQIVLVGQPELDDLLARHELRQLAQRIAVKAHIRALSPEESEAYIAHRLMQAGCIREQVFSNGALKAIVRHCQGTPRALNIACDNALIAGFGGQEEIVSLPTAKEVLRDLKGVSRRRGQPKWALPAGLAAAAVILLGLAFISGGAMSASDLEADVAVSQVAVEAPIQAKMAEQPEAAPSEEQAAKISPEEAEEVPTRFAEAEDIAAASETVAADAESVEVVQEEHVQLAARTTAGMDTREIALQRIAERSRELERGIMSQPGEETPAASPVEEISAEAIAPSGVEEVQESEEVLVAALPVSPEPAAEAEAVSQKDAEVPAEMASSVQPNTEESAEILSEPVTFQTAESNVSLGSGGEAPDPFSGIPEIRKAVVEGDQLLRILVQTYGFHSPPLVAAVLERNPQIDDMNYIRAGDTLVLPAPDELNLAEGRKQSNSDRNPS